MVRRIALAGGLRIDDTPQPPSTGIRTGQTIELHVRAEPVPRDGHRPAEPLVVLATTQDIVYVDKPPNLHTVAKVPGDPGCLATNVVDRFPECRDASADPREGGAVHRLDFETSGVVAFARSRDAWARVRAGFDQGRVHKRYLALCGEPASGWPPVPSSEADPSWWQPGTTFDPSSTSVVPWRTRTSVATASGTITAPLGHGSNRDHVAVRHDGLSARTHVHLVARGSAATLLLEIDLETGRRHQARVHLAWIGMPIVGDARYGSSTSGRLMLHAISLDLSDTLPHEAQVNTTSHTTLFGPFVSA